MATIISWTKTAEIEALKELAERLGERSYLGPWLREVMPQIEEDIRNDFQIAAPMPAECGRRAVEIMEEANRSAAATRTQAVVDAEQTIKQAHDRRRRILEGVKDILRKAEREIIP